MKYFQSFNRLISNSVKAPVMNSVPSVTSNFNQVLPYKCVPGPQPLPFLGNTWRFIPYIGQFYQFPYIVYKVYFNVIIQAISKLNT